MSPVKVGQCFLAVACGGVENNEKSKKHRKKLSVPNKDMDQFEVLGEDAVLSIFSFIGHAPLEKIARNPGDSELTHCLPGVSKFWQEMAQHDCLWKPAILRQLQREPALWTEGLVSLVKSQKTWDATCLAGDESFETLLERVREALGNASYKKLYRQVVSEYIRQVLPVFYMPGHVMLGGSYRLHLFEPRYRLLVAELLKGYPREAKKGELTASEDRPAPIFIHANRQPFGASSPACLVQMVRCNISDRDGTADIMLLPIAYLWLEKVWIRPNSGNLHYAQSIRMGQKATREMHALVNQETLGSILSQVGDYNSMDYWTDDEDYDDDYDDMWD
jgi:hypothetical protein